MNNYVLACGLFFNYYFGNFVLRLNLMLLIIHVAYLSVWRIYGVIFFKILGKLISVWLSCGDRPQRVNLRALPIWLKIFSRCVLSIPLVQFQALLGHNYICQLDFNRRALFRVRKSYFVADAWLKRSVIYVLTWVGSKHHW